MGASTVYRYIFDKVLSETRKCIQLRCYKLFIIFSFIRLVILSNILYTHCCQICFDSIVITIVFAEVDGHDDYLTIFNVVGSSVINSVHRRLEREVRHR